VAGRNDLWLETRVSWLLTSGDPDRSDVWLTLKCRLLTFNQHCLSFQIWDVAVKPELSLIVAPPPGLASEQHQISCSVAGVFNPSFSFLFCPHFENPL